LTTCPTIEHKERNGRRVDILFSLAQFEVVLHGLYYIGMYFVRHPAKSSVLLTLVAFKAEYEANNTLQTFEATLPYAGFLS